MILIYLYLIIRGNCNRGEMNLGGEMEVWMICNTGFFITTFWGFGRFL
jgi:hypothetical protein